MFCPKCGTNVNDEFKFCFNCGFDLSVLKGTGADSSPSGSKERQKDSFNSNYKDLSEIGSFDGSQSEYERIYYKYIYDEVDLYKANALDKFAAENYPDKTYQLEYYLGIRTDWLQMIEKLEGQPIKGILAELQGANEVINYAQFAGLLTSIAYFNDVIGQRRYASQKFYYDWVKDLNKYSDLQNRISNSSDEKQRTILERQAEELERKYDGSLNLENFILKYTALMDVRHTQADISSCAVKYSSWVDETYTLFLSNAARKHNTDILNKMYPTTEQRNRFRKIVEDKILDKMRYIYGKIALVGQKADECSRLSNNIIELNKKTSGDELLKKGALSLGLAVISGPMGILNGIREGYNYYEADKKAQELREKLWQEFESLCDEYSELTDECTEACENINIIMQDEVAAKYLCPAINNILAALKSRNVELLPLSEYFAK